MTTIDAVADKQHKCSPAAWSTGGGLVLAGRYADSAQYPTLRVFARAESPHAIGITSLADAYATVVRKIRGSQRQEVLAFRRFLQMARLLTARRGAAQQRLPFGPSSQGQPEVGRGRRGESRHKEAIGRRTVKSFPSEKTRAHSGSRNMTLRSDIISYRNKSHSSDRCSLE